MADIVVAVARPMMFTGRVNALRNWLAALPEVSFQTQPLLGVYRDCLRLAQAAGYYTLAAHAMIQALRRTYF